MKIIHVLPKLTKGGGELVTLALANRSASQGHEVTIIVGCSVNHVGLVKNLSPLVQVLCISGSKSSKFKMYSHLFWWQCRNFTYLLKYDLIHCHLTYGEFFGLFAIIIRRLFSSHRPAVVSTCHSAGMNMSVFARWLHGKIYKKFDGLAVVASDDYWTLYLRRHSSLVSTIIPNGIPFEYLDGVDVKKLYDYRRSIGIPDTCEYVVGTLGRLSKDRKPWIYLPIFAKIIEEFGPQVHFIIGGDGPEYEFLNSLIAEQGMEKQIHLPGLIQDQKYLLSLCDVYVTLNIGDITGISGLEAAYLGKPVVGFQLLSRYKSKSNDWIWSSTEYSEVSKKIASLIQNSENRRDIALQQSAHVRSRHSVYTMGSAYDELYLKAMKINK